MKCKNIGCKNEATNIGHVEFCSEHCYRVYGRVHNYGENQRPHLTMPQPETIQVWDDEEDIKRKNRDLLESIVDVVVHLPDPSEDDNFSGGGGEFEGGGASGSWDD